MLETSTSTATPAVTRRLSNRRGSVSAGDPYGKHFHLTDSVQSSSTLTIVRVVSPQPTSPTPEPRRYGRRHGSISSQSTTTTSPDNTRLSFAFSTFAGPSPAPGRPATNTSPSSSPRLRPSSPRRLSMSSLSSKPRLTPDQLLDLARSTDPHYSSTQSHSPSHSPLLRAHSPIGQNQSTAPATFTPLPDYIYLPFIDRPSEVASLIASSPSAKLFSLLAQIFQNPTGAVPSSTSSSSPSDDPTTWTYSQLYEHLTTVTRSQMPDTVWVALARKCVLLHSELIWERIKGALGVPPELDVDYDIPLDELRAGTHSSSASSVDTDEISDDHGRSARGHWEDWDAVMDSPVFDRRHASASSPPSPLIAFSSTHGPQPSAGDKDESVSLLGGGVSTSPIKTSFDYVHTPASPSSFLSIEPILLPSSPFALVPQNAPPPFSLSNSETIGSMSLGDIQESAEDETETEVPTPAEGQGTPTGEAEDPDLISPAQIQGLRISTAPFNLPPNSPVLVSSLNPISTMPSAPPNSSSSLSSYVAPSPISPLPPYPSIGKSRSSSISSTGAGSSSSFRRSGSWGSLSSALGRGEQEEEGYNPVGDRSPGNPLFPSNFARLAVGPTLVANNPTLRSPPLPPQSRYSTNLSPGLFRSLHGPKPRTYSHGAGTTARSSLTPGGTSVDASRRQSWGYGPRVGSQGNDYAVSVTSVDSIE